MKKKRLLIALIMLLLLSTYSIQDHSFFSSKFNIKKIIIQNNLIIENEIVEKKLSYLYDENILFFSRKNLEIKLKEISFIESFKIKKIYPDKLIVKIFEKKPIAIIQNKKEKNYYTEKGEIINFSELEIYKNLPIVFGDKDNFKVFYFKLNKIKFPIETIKTFYFFDSRRWDIVTISNQLIKLPAKNFEKSLKNFLGLKDHNNFYKYKVFDYRIQDQLILK